MSKKELIPEQKPEVLTNTTEYQVAKQPKPEERVTINYKEGVDLTFRLVKWNPTKVLKRLPEYGSILAVPLSMYPKDEERGFSDYEQKIAMAFLQFFAGLDEKELDSLVKEVLDEVYTEKGESVSIYMDELFIKCPEVLIELCGKVLEINYAPFIQRGFNGLLTQLKGLVPLSQK